MFSPWLDSIDRKILSPRKRAIENHPFTIAMKNGVSEPRHAERYFSGLMWHLLDFGKHVGHLMEKRDPAVATFLAGRSEDADGDTEILGRIVDAFGGPGEQIRNRPWSYRPHPVWIRHDALLRSAIYSRDLPWQVGTAALNVGIESLVPTMIEPLFQACIEKYGVTKRDAQWLESRSGEEERQHGENGYLVLDRFVDKNDTKLQDQCTFFIDALSGSMAYGLLESGLRGSESKQ
jgi:pyrroloquinoline quinone (PQQ) biosynthesis protein C